MPNSPKPPITTVQITFWKLQIKAMFLFLNFFLFSWPSAPKKCLRFAIFNSTKYFTDWTFLKQDRTKIALAQIIFQWVSVSLTIHQCQTHLKSLFQHHCYRCQVPKFLQHISLLLTQFYSPANYHFSSH